MMSDTIVANNIEVLRVDSQESLIECAHKLSAPAIVKDGTGGVLVSNGDFIIVICGGHVVGTEDHENSNCFSLHDQTKSDLSIARIGAASLAIENGRSLWLTGGYSATSNNNDLLATEVVAHKQDASSEPGSLLPIHSLSQHCLEKINTNTALLIGGENYHIGVDGMSWFYKLNSTARSWLGPQLNIARSRHACGVLRDKTMPNSSAVRLVVAAGGQVDDNTVTDSVEVLFLEDEGDIHNSEPSWMLSSEPMPVKTASAATATTSDQLHMFVIGGTSSLVDFEMGSTSIFVLSCSGETCRTWSKLQLDLRNPIAKGLAFMIPSYAMEGRADTGHLIKRAEGN